MLHTLGNLALEGSSFRRSKPLLLLAYLTLEGSKTRRELADLFYLDTKDPRDSLSTALGYLKREANSAEADSSKAWATVDCDAKKLLELLDGGEFDQALSHYQGSFLAGIDVAMGEELEEWVYKTREFLASRVREAHLKLAEKAFETRQYDVAAKHAETAYGLDGATELEPEDMKRLYPLLYMGKSPKAPELRQEAEAFDIKLEIKELPKETASNVQQLRHNLPPRTTSFVGRDPELLEVANLLANPDCRLVTLHGLGGAGKTRLAVQAAYDQLESGIFRDGIFFVSLASLTSPDLIPLAVAEALNLSLQGQEDGLTQIKNFIGQQSILLVLDNFEQLMVAATLPAELIAACPNLKILVTSRERLNVAEEWVLSLGGLTLPSQESKFEDAAYSEAVQLFVQRAKRVRLDFALNSATSPHVLKICQLVEGYPLGLELAAAWVRAMPLEDIASEIESNLDFLSSMMRNVNDRQQSLRATFEYSWKSLNTKEQTALRKLSVFRGGFRREAASEVTSATLPLLASLVDKSLLRTSANGRYDRHALLYQYMQEKFAENNEEEQQTRDQHATYFLMFAEQANQALNGEQQALWLSRLEEDHDNLRSALTWILSKGDAETALRLVRALSRFWDVHGHFTEGLTWIAKALALPASVEFKDMRARVLNAAGVLAKDQGDYAAARAYLEEGLLLSKEVGDKRSIVSPLNNLGIVAYHQNDYVAAQHYYEQSLVLLRELNNTFGVAYVLQNLGNVAHDLGDYVLARRYKEEGLELLRGLDDGIGIAIALANVAITAIEQEDYALAKERLAESLKLSEVLGDSNGIATAKQLLGFIALLGAEEVGARSLLEESLKLFRQSGDKVGISSTLMILGDAGLEQNDEGAAHPYYDEALSLLEQLKQPKGIAALLERKAALAANREQWARAICLCAAANSLRETFKTPLPPSERSRYQKTLASLHVRVDKATFESYWEEGKTWTLEQAVNYALAQARAFATTSLSEMDV